MLFDYYSEREKTVVFANTGLEHEKTLKFVDDCDKAWGLNVVWVEADVHSALGVGTTHRVVNFETASRHGEPFEAMIQKYGIPNVAFPHCTRELKQKAIHSYVRSLGWKDYETAIGIRVDEQHRINHKEAEKHNWIYPLVDIAPMTEEMIRQWNNQLSFGLKLDVWDGNCRGCFKKSDKKLVRALTRNPNTLDWHLQMEKQYSLSINGNRSEKLHPTYFFRGNRNAQDIQELAEIASRQSELFNTLSEMETDCMCKSS